MAEYIKREDAHVALEKAPTGYWGSEGHLVYADDAHKQIDQIRSADVQPVVHGEWVDGGVDGVGACGIEYRYNKCSVCGYEYSFPMKYNFCPNCGARMV